MKKKKLPAPPKLVAISYHNPDSSGSDEDEYNFSNTVKTGISYQIYHFKRTRVLSVHQEFGGWASRHESSLSPTDIFGPYCKVNGVMIHGFSSPSLFLLWILTERIDFTNLKYGEVLKEFFEELL